MKFNFLTTAIVPAVLVSAASGATIVNPTLGSVIDPTGNQEVTLGAGSADESHGTALTTLNSRSDLNVLQDFAGFTGGTGGNIVSFTDLSFPDIRFSLSGDDVNAGVASAGASLNVSGGTAINLDNDGSIPPTLTISFGTWNGSTFTADRDVLAAGFVLTQVLNLNVREFDVTFRDSAGASITSFNNLSGNVTASSDPEWEGSWPEIYVGWDSEAESSNAIAEIVVAVKNVGGGNGASSGLDDFAFTAIPEPSTGLFGLFGSLLLLRRRR